MATEAPTIVVRPLAYQGSLQTRTTDAIDLVVIHCTELPDLAAARSAGEHIHYPLTASGNSGHFYIDRDGHIERWVDIQRIAHHVRGFNQRSIGIELVNLGRFPDWLHSDRQTMREAYPVAQIDSLKILLNWLSTHIATLRCIAGHEDLDMDRVPASNDPSVQVRRKQDPGPLFPWTRLMQTLPLQRLYANTGSVVTE